MPRMVFLFAREVRPYTTTTYKGKFVAGTAYQDYSIFKQRVAGDVSADMAANGWERSEGQPLRIAVIYNRGVTSVGLHRRDLTNILKGTEDAAQKVAYKNDAWTDQEIAMRANSEQVGDLLLLVVQPIIEGPKRFSKWVHQVEEIAEEHGFILWP